MSVRTRRRANRPAALDAGRKPGRAPPQIGDHNLRVTLEAIRRDGPLTRLELASRSGLTGPGVTNILRRLSEDGLVIARKRAEKGTGQPSTIFAINPDGAFGLGVRLRDGSAEAILLDLGGKTRVRLASGPAADPVALTGRLVAEASSKLAASGRLLGVGIAAEDPASLELSRLSEALHPAKLFAEQDCMAALLAERILGVGPVEGGMMMILIDDRVRAGFLFRGAPFRGVHNRAGSIGRMRTGADHVPLEEVATLEVLRRAMTPAECAKLAAGGEIAITSPVREWIRNAAGHLVDAIVATAGFLAPGAILIGGDLPANIIQELIAEISAERGNTAIRPFISPWISTIRPATFPDAGIAVGAALLPFFEALLPAPRM